MGCIKYCISFSKDFYKKIKHHADARGVTMAGYIKEAIAKRMESEFDV